MRLMCFLCALMTSCWCLCRAPAAPDWCWALLQFAIGLAGFLCLEFATKHDVHAQEKVQILLLVCMFIMCMHSFFLALARFGACIIWTFTQIWKTQGVREVRTDVISLCDLMQHGSVGPILCFFVLVLYMQRPWKYGVC